jgi:DNA-directed RNA polymerase subunit omega
MARITVEDCLRNVNNRFALIHLAAKRVRQLRKGSDPTIVSKNKDVVVALREIAANTVVQAEEIENPLLVEGNIALSEEIGGEEDEKASE